MFLEKCMRPEDDEQKRNKIGLGPKILKFIWKNKQVKDKSESFNKEEM